MEDTEVIPPRHLTAMEAHPLAGMVGRLAGMVDRHLVVADMVDRLLAVADMVDLHPTVADMDLHQAAAAAAAAIKPKGKKIYVFKTQSFSLYQKGILWGWDG